MNYVKSSKVMNLKKQIVLNIAESASEDSNSTTRVHQVHALDGWSCL